MVPVVLAVVILAIVVWQVSRRRLNRSRTLRGSGNGNPQRVPARLMKELDRLTRDRRLSARLVERIAFNHPHRSRRWCVEKAIYDLQRDRRS
jgi:hypothetical protein